MKEAINIPIEVGDVILGGKFLNKKVIVKTIEMNERGEPLINGKPLMKYRLTKSVSERINILKERLKPVYWIKCPKCPAKFSTASWDNDTIKLSDGTCPKCGYTGEFKDFKIIRKM